MTRVEPGLNEPVVVLLAEDETLIRMVTADTLTDAGYRVVQASNADEARALLEARADIRLLVTDVKMPGQLDGFELARLVGRRWPDIRIIITSGHAHPGDETVPDGTVFLPKPIRATLLLSHLAALTADGTGEPASGATTL